MRVSRCSKRQHKEMFVKSYGMTFVVQIVVSRIMPSSNKPQTSTPSTHLAKQAYRIFPTFYLEALAVYDTWSRFVILFLTDPHTLECRQRSQDRSANPHGVLSLWWSHNLHLDRCRSQCSDFLCHTLVDSREHGSTSRQNNIRVQIFTDINITFHNGLESRVSNTIHFQSGEVRLEQYLRTSESFISNNNDISIRKLKTLLQSR